MYTLLAINECSGCKGISLDIGLKQNPYVRLKCGECSLMSPLNSNAVWLDSRRFRPISDVTATLAQEAMERIVIERPEHINEPEIA